MATFRSNPASTILLIGLLAWIAFVLIVPQVDLQDATFRSKESPLAVHSQTLDVSQADAINSVPGIPLVLRNASDVALAVMFDSAVEIPSTAPQVLRC
jgi:hypothetical protein